MRDINKEIEIKKKELEDLELEREEFNTLTPERRLAEYLHGYLCHWNHTDTCGWFYSSWKFPCNTRFRYKQIAKKMLDVEPSFDHIIAILKAMQST